MDPQLQDSLGRLMTKIGPVGVTVLLIFVWIKLDKKIRKAVRTKIWSAVKAVARNLWHLTAVAWWALKNGIPFRLALRLQPDRWNAMVEARRLSGLKRGKIKRTPVGVSVRLTLSGALTSRDVHNRTRQLETGLGLKSGTARLGHVSRSDKLVLQIVLRNPIKDLIPWERPRDNPRLSDPLRFSITEFGDTVSLDVKNRIGIFGESGSGKSCAQRLIGAHVIQAVDAQLEIWDLKFGTESQHYKDKAYRVTTVEDSLDRLDWLIGEEFPRRALVMKRQESSEWRETAADPALVVIIDEGNVVVRGYKPEQIKKLLRAIEQGRALGVYFVWATQFPKHTNLPTELRSQLNVTVCLKLKTSKENLVVFGDDTQSGWAAHLLQDKGWVLVKSPGHPKPVESKAVWLSPEDFRAIPLRGDIPGMRLAPATEAAPEPAPVKASVAGEVVDVLMVSPDPMGISELARKTGRSKAAVHAACKKLETTGSLVKAGRGYTVAVNEGDEG